VVDVENPILHSSEKSQSDFSRLTSEKIALTSEKSNSTSEKIALTSEKSNSTSEKLALTSEKH